MSPAASAAGLRIMVNGVAYTVRSTPDTPLLYLLRNELGLHGPRFGCGLGQCGACTVHVSPRGAASHARCSAIGIPKVSHAGVSVGCDLQ